SVACHAVQVLPIVRRPELTARPSRRSSLSFALTPSIGRPSRSSWPTRARRPDASWRCSGLMKIDSTQISLRHGHLCRFPACPAWASVPGVTGEDHLQDRDARRVAEQALQAAGGGLLGSLLLGGEATGAAVSVPVEASPSVQVVVGRLEPAAAVAHQ